MFEYTVQSGQMMFDHRIGFGPFAMSELIDEEFHFDLGLALGMEVTAGVTAEGFD